MRNPGIQPHGIYENFLKVGAIAALLSFCFASEYIQYTYLPSRFLNQSRDYIYSWIQSQDRQIWFFAGGFLYIIAFIRLVCRLTTTRNILSQTFAVSSLLFLTIAGIAYIGVPQTTEALVLCFGFVIFFGFMLWRATEVSGSNSSRLVDYCQYAVLLALSIAAVCHPFSMNTYRYRGHVRWTGLWLSPNTLGCLMGTGFVLAIADILRLFLPFERNQRTKFKGVDWGMLLSVVAATLTGFALLKSHSRGAWVGVFVGVLMLAFLLRSAREQKNRSLFTVGRRHLRFLTSLGLTLFFSMSLVLWNLRSTEQVEMRRALSVLNSNDFSWRNRVSAYAGALQMMMDRPWFGFGWNQPMVVYERFYRPFDIEEASAIQTNDFVMVATTLGLPALACFVISLWLALKANMQRMVETEWRRRTLSAAAVVGLVSFFFDGGLFKVASAGVFWILLGVGSTVRTPPQPDSSVSI